MDIMGCDDVRTLRLDIVNYTLTIEPMTTHKHDPLRDLCEASIIPLDLIGLAVFVRY
jgi:hypothetical protein